jgi:hypothetical protein
MNMHPLAHARRTKKGTIITDESTWEMLALREMLRATNAAISRSDPERMQPKMMRQIRATLESPQALRRLGEREDVHVAGFPFGQ